MCVKRELHVVVEDGDISTQWEGIMGWSGIENKLFYIPTANMRKGLHSTPQGFLTFLRARDWRALSLLRLRSSSILPPLEPSLAVS